MANKMILEIPVQPEKVDEFIAMITPALADTRAYDGCLGLEFLTREDSPGTVWFYETWESKAHQEKYFAWRIETGLVAALAPFLSGEPKMIWLNEHPC